DVAHLADEIGYSASMVWSATSEPVFDVIFRKKGTPWTNPRVGPVEYAALDSYTNNPLRQAIVRQLLPELRQWLKKQLPDYMVPSTYMVLETFPLTPSGKTDRRALPAPGKPRLDREAAFSPPRSQTEIELARIWAEVLRIDHIGINHDFFALGGHSLLATQVVSRIKTNFNRELTLRTFFENPTIAGLAKQIDESSVVLPQTPEITPVNREAFRVKRPSLLQDPLNQQTSSARRNSA